MPPNLEDTRKRYAAADPPQDHVLTFYDALPSEQQTRLLDQLASIDPVEVSKAYAKAVDADKRATSGHGAESIEPPPASASGSLVDGGSNGPKWQQRGFDAIKTGQVAVLCLAGGQGTRLGYSGPKGCYDIKLPSHKSLFQLQVERLRALEKLAGGKVPLYVMTSGPTRGPTERYFEQNSYFGLDKTDVIFFDQGVLPCFDEKDGGTFLLEAKGALAVAPDGNGGLYPALRAPLSVDSNSTVLSDMRKRGIKYVHAFCVDNCLVRVADPFFVGYCIERNADVGALVVRKTKPDESVGVLALKDGKFNILEYSELPKALAEKRDSQDESQLAFRAANIANHFYTLDFLDGVHKHSTALHVARKKVPYVDLSNAQVVKPDQPNAIKLEAFIFDVFPFAQRMAVLEDDRADVFSPLKNKAGTGSDDEGTSRAALLAQQKRWLGAAGAATGSHEVELAPGVSLYGESLDSVKGKTANKSGSIESTADLASFFA